FNPRAVIFLNTGVKLSSEGSPIISSLVRLEQRGTEILSCGTCLDYYGLKDKLCVGRVTNIYDVVEFVTTASKVVSI
ncbi:MAG: sulfurtransferase-like selenium metabolism protein YedF, partial [Clostridia bacterium]|nr:sulfurtransferase-like selenium metabolism protein YedF [Clostridia bacterium]